MKYNINKLQGGGLVAFTPIIDSPKQKSSSQGQPQEQQSLLDDEIYKEQNCSGYPLHCLVPTDLLWNYTAFQSEHQSKGGDCPCGKGN